MKTNSVRTIAAALSKHFLLLSLFMLGGLLLSGCKQDTKATAGGDITGVYTLVTVAGNKVPASISHEGTTLQVRSGSFTINGDETCGSKTTFVPPSGGKATRDVSATYTRDGSKLTMQWQGAGMTTATVEGGTLTMNNEGMLFVYTK
jgi:hypothetical protein